MYLHKENRELFRDAILLASERLKVSEDVVEKDYYVTLILQKLAVIDYPVVFKGGTSLSKAYRLIDRFSEDIDITFTEHLGEARRKKLKYNILKPIASELGLEIRNFDSIESDRDLNHYDFYYESVVGDRVSNPISAYVKLETSLKSYAFPTEEQMLGNYLLEALGEEEAEIIREYGLAEFPMRVQTVERTLIDKIFAVCDYYLQNKPHRNARHLYDIYKLAFRVEINDSFKKLVEEVRDHRITLGVGIAPAAPRDVDILKLAKQICKDDFYKDDYKDTTVKLISDNLEYEMLRDFYLELVERILADEVCMLHQYKNELDVLEVNKQAPAKENTTYTMRNTKATVEGDQPRVRPFGTAHIFEGKLYIQTGKVKDVSKQIHANPKVEICAFKNGEWLRVAGELVEDDRREARQSMLDAYPSLQKMYSADDGNTEVFYFKNATATFSSFTYEPEVVKF